MEDKILTIPAVALRGMTILPGMVAHFDISRDKSLRAVEEAMKGDQKLFIVTQKDTEKEDPQGEDLYEVGLLAGSSGRKITEKYYACTDRRNRARRDI